MERELSRHVRGFITKVHALTVRDAANTKNGTAKARSRGMSFEV